MQPTTTRRTKAKPKADKPKSFTYKEIQEGWEVLTRTEKRAKSLREKLQIAYNLERENCNNAEYKFVITGDFYYKEKRDRANSKAFYFLCQIDRLDEKAKQKHWNIKPLNTQGEQQNGNFKRRHLPH